MMTDCFDKLYTQVSNMSNMFLRKGMRLLIRVVANVVIPIYYYFTHNKQYSLCDAGRQSGRIIVTLTSFPMRIEKLHIVCESLLRQSCQPDKIVIWLSNLQFTSKNVLPRKLLQLQDRGVEIRLVDGDIRSHKKYYYAFAEFAEDNIITIDDDILYRSTMIEDLVDCHKKNPDCIIAQWGRKVERKGGVLLSYGEWRKIESNPFDVDVFFGSGGGTFFSPHSLYKDVLQKDLFLKLTPYADDVWLNAMARLQGTKIIKTKYYSANLEIMYKKNKTLASVNNSSYENQNDVQIKNLLKYYGEKLVW